MEKAKVISVTNTSVDTFVLQVEKVFEFLPGQTMELSTDGENFEKVHVCNGIQYDHLNFFMKEDPNIDVTQSVADLIEQMNDAMGEGKSIPDN